MERVQTKIDGEDSTVDSPSLHKDDLLDEEDNDMSENESVGTQPEEVTYLKIFKDYNFLILRDIYLIDSMKTKHR